MSPSLHAQIVVTPTAGCAPLGVTMSGPSGASNVFWTIGASQTSTLATVSQVFTTPGIYNITYTAIVNGNPVSYNTQVHVSSGPTGNFSYVLPSGHCAPMVVQFTGSGGSPGSTLLWSFGDLSPLANGGSLTHTYVGAGNFVPVMVIIDAVSGCTAVASGGGTIHVSAPPNLVISSSNGFTGCTPPFTTNISSNGSTSGSPTGGGLQGFNWQIQGGSPSSASAPSVGLVTFGAGVHTITMSASDNNQCSGTKTAVVTVLSPTIAAVMQPTIVCLGDTVKAKIFSSMPSLIVNHDQAPPNVHNMVTTPLSWQFPLSTVNYTADSITTATVPGLHNLTITINPPGCAPMSTVIPYFVEHISPLSFTGTPPTSSCGHSMTATYVSQCSVNTGYALTYTWAADGGGGYNNAFPSPQTGSVATFTITQGSVNPYTIYYPWSPMIHMRVQSSSPAGCVYEIMTDMFDTIQRLTSWFYTDKLEGCSPLTVTYRDSSFTLLGGVGPNNQVYPLLSYSLYTPGGTPSYSTGTNLHFSVTTTYSAPGTYSAYMITKGVNGCMDTSFTRLITVVDPPTVGITYTSNLSVCAGNTLQLNLTGAPSTINHWHATTDDWLFSGCITNSSPTFSFTHVGVQGVTVTAYDHGCVNTVPTTQSITVKGPYGSMRYRTTCAPATRKTVDFDILLQEVQSAQLSFGDNSPPVTLTGNATGTQTVSVSHTYAGSGNYPAVLTSSNSITGCGPVTFSTLVKVRELNAIITDTLNNPITPLPGSFSCRNRSVIFKASNSTSELVGCKVGFRWYLEGPGTFTTLPENVSTPIYQSDVLVTPGNYTISLRVTDDNSCVSEQKVVFRVSDMKLGFSPAPNPVCLENGTIHIVNTLTLDPADVVTGYKWDFGDGSGVIGTSSATPYHTYTMATTPYQLFVISGTVTNNTGCSDSLRVNVKVNNPYPNLQPSEILPCIPKSSGKIVTFNAAAGYATYSLSYNDPRTGPPQWVTLGSIAGASHSYSLPGIYVPTLVVVDADGCKSAEQRTIYAIGQPTATIFFADGTSKFCYPATPSIVSVPLINQSQVTNQIWKVGSVTTPPPGSQTLPYIFTEPGVTTISLTVDTAGFCPNTATASVVISDPKASLLLDKKKFCIGDTIHVSITDSSGTFVESWRWFFGDLVPQPQIYSLGILAQLTRTLSYPYSIFPSDSTGKATIVLRYEGMQASCVRYSSTDIQVIKIDAAMKHVRDDYRHCLDVPDDFVSITPNPANNSLVYAWSFGDNSTGSGKTSSHTYQAPGVYNVQLTVNEAQYGCTARAQKTMTILPLPTASLSITPSLVCPGTTFAIAGSGTPGESGHLTGTLEPAAGNYSFGANNTFTVEGTTVQTATYSLKVTDENTCVSKPAFAVINLPPHANEVHWDTTIIIGQTVTLNANQGPGYTYSWSPVITDLSCETCYDPVSISTVNITYTVLVTDDPLRCFTTSNTYSIFINPLTSIDVPSAFTPNADGVNDVVYVGGWGIRKLVYFRIFNRWGQLLFQTNDLKTGWDGRFEGMMQNMETYVYEVAAETYLNTTLSKTGTVKLLR